ncbi:rhodanese-like domain-containing protein [Tropicibacter naphthalenivorans]|uniref:Rhodanese-like domain protein n=1 Tax=Tropicibacter naphthalenivorans TaxID=441103 RepID=A0A0P1GC37_9RHOB|nr:rhodanese-like domain-containing protein [Tropicibacter naphthalenivorans]CUH79037.1 Rhodanese-like domain protein [Tropicibacter naphthalenivorans]SMD03833.1 Rhodanese-like domain-containing protein [Tropicibacter naphthalenivorans]
MFKGLFPTLCCAAAVAMAVPACAQSSRITEDRGSFQFTLNGRMVTIDRNGAACPPACVQPMQAAPGVATIGELEVMDFLDIFVSGGRGLLIDARLPTGFSAGTVPGAVNVPAATLGPDNPYRDDLLNALGVRSGDFSGAFDLVLFGAGPDDEGAQIALRSLLDSGYPAEKLKYYRGGVQAWMGLGLTTAGGQ